MDYSSLRAEARRRLAGKWGKVILVSIVTSLVIGLISYIPSLAKTKTIISYYGFGAVVVTQDNPLSLILTLVADIIAFVFSYGLISALWKVYNGEEVGVADGLKIAIANWKRALFVLINIIKKLLIPVIMIIAALFLPVIIVNGVVTVICIILAIVGGIWAFIEGLHYALAPVITADEPNLSEEDVVNKSKDLMTHKRGNLVVLSLTFIGWILLGTISLGIGMLWVAPYMQFATFAFYEKCKGVSSSDSEPKAE